MSGWGKRARTVFIVVLLLILIGCALAAACKHCDPTIRIIAAAALLLGIAHLIRYGFRLLLVRLDPLLKRIRARLSVRAPSPLKRAFSALGRMLESLSSAILEFIGNLVGILLLVCFLTFGWEYIRLKALGSPSVSFQPVTLKYAIDVQTRVPPASVEGQGNFVSVFFPNGSSDLTGDQKVWVNAVANAVRACPGSHLYIDGFASSRRYRTNSDAKNLVLVTNRIKALLAVAGFSVDDDTVVLSKWGNIDEMHKAAKFEDQLDDPRAKLALETLNRRVTVRVDLAPPCSGAYQKGTLTSGTTSP